MMALIFGVLTLALLLSFLGRSRLASATILACLLLSIGEFLWLIHSPKYGFRMPWIQVDLMLHGTEPNLGS